MEISEEAVKILVKCQKNNLENFDQDQEKKKNLDNFFDCMRSPVSGRIVENYTIFSICKNDTSC